jgi:hypothetical protein
LGLWKFNAEDVEYFVRFEPIENKIILSGFMEAQKNYSINYSFRGEVISFENNGMKMKYVQYWSFGENSEI